MTPTTTPGLPSIASAFHEGKAEAHTLVLTLSHTVGAVERLENIGLVFRRDTNPPVLNGNNNLFGGFALQADANRESSCTVQCG